MAIKKATKAQKVKFVVDCTLPVNDSILDISQFARFYMDRIKVNGKAGNLGDKVAVVSDKNKITINADLPFAKRYLKYLAKKYLKQQSLRDFIRVIATKKDQYELRYFQVADDM